MTYELYHHGILGMKWGIRRYQNADGSLTNAGKKRYASTSIGAAIARRQNAKVDASFKQWNEQSKLKENAINAGHKYNEAKIAGADKKELKSLKKDYKKSLRKVTTYRKGQVKQDVGQDMSRKYLTQANRVYKQMQQDPNNRELQKEYQRLMNLHDKERFAARRAASVGAARSQTKASIKRAMTMTAKGIVGAAVVGAGVAYVNKKYGGNLNINYADIINAARKAKNIFRMVY